MKQPQQNENVNPNHSSKPQGFHVGVIFSNKGVDISPQGTLSLSYKQLWSAIATSIVLFTGWSLIAPQTLDNKPSLPPVNTTNQVK